MKDWRKTVLIVFLMCSSLFIRTQETMAAEEDWPMMLSGDNWYNFPVNRINISEVEFMDSYEPNGTEVSSCFVDVANEGKITAYLLQGRKKIIIAGNGKGKIRLNPDSSCLFQNFRTVKEISGLEIVDAKEVRIVDAMFKDCFNLREIKIEQLNLQNVISAVELFCNCSILENVDLKTMKFDNLTDASSMFYNCASLKKLEFPSSYSTKLQNMSRMFCDCYELQELDISGLDTSQVTDMTGMFENCCSLEELKFSKTSTNRLLNVKEMFKGCESLEEVDLTNLKTSKVYDFSAMFEGCTRLQELDADQIDLSKAETLNSMFAGCTSLQKLSGRFHAEGVKQAEGMFKDCVALKELNLSGMFRSKIEKASSLAEGCTALEKLNLGFNLDHIYDSKEFNLFGHTVYPALQEFILPQNLKVSVGLPETNGHFYYEGNEISVIPLGVKDTAKLTVMQKVRFLDSDDFSLLQECIVERGSTVVQPPDPAKTSAAYDFSFAGWTEADSTEFDFSQPLTGDRDIYAQWEKKLRYYTVSYDAENGTPVATASVAYRAKAPQPETPEKTGRDNESYRFLGWFCLGQQFDFETLIEENLSLTARWEKVIVSEEEDQGQDSEQGSGENQGSEDDPARRNNPQAGEDPQTGNDSQAGENPQTGENSQQGKETESVKEETGKKETGKGESGKEQDSGREDSRENKKDSGADSENKKDSGTDSENKKDSGADSENKKNSGADSENKKDFGVDSENKKDSGTDSENKNDSGAVSKKTKDSETGSIEKKDSENNAGETKQAENRSDSGGSSGTGSSSSGSTSSGSFSGGTSGPGSSSAGPGSSNSGGSGSSGSGVLSVSTATFSKFWYQTANGSWRICRGNGAMLTSVWLCDNAVIGNGKNVWYLIGAGGDMISHGLVQDNTGNYYSLETTHNGYFGMLRYKDGFYRCGNQTLYITFNHEHNGSFGAITNQDVINALKKQYGVAYFPIGNEKCVYTADF